VESLTILYELASLGGSTHHGVWLYNK
jgi:hypothetical protein